MSFCSKSNFLCRVSNPTKKDLALTNHWEGFIRQLIESGRYNNASEVVRAADGLENQEIAARLGQDKMKVGRWRQRYAKGGLPAILKDKSRPGRIAPVPPAVISKIIQLTTTARPAGATHWSRASMAREAGVSESTVGRIWGAHGLKPLQVKSSPSRSAARGRGRGSDNV